MKRIIVVCLFSSAVLATSVVVAHPHPAVQHHSTTSYQGQEVLPAPPAGHQVEPHSSPSDSMHEHAHSAPAIVAPTHSHCTCWQCSPRYGYIPMTRKVSKILYEKVAYTAYKRKWFRSTIYDYNRCCYVPITTSRMVPYTALRDIPRTVFVDQHYSLKVMWQPTCNCGFGRWIPCP